VDAYPLIREIRSPITDDQLRPLDPRCQVVQFSAPLSESDFVQLARFLANYPNVPLRIYGHYAGAEDLAFLRHFPFLKGFQADVFEIASWEGLQYLPETLEYLGLGATRHRFSLQQIARFTTLKDLNLEGHSKDIPVLSAFTDLRYLTLRSISMPDLSVLQPLRNLRSLALKLGGTNQLAMLPALHELRYLELWMVRGLSDLSAIAELPELRYLFLQDLKRVTSIPSLGSSQALRRVHVEALKSLTDLAPIAAAPNLEELVLISMSHLRVQDLACFQRHPTLRAATIGLGSKRRNEQATATLGLPSVKDAKPIRNYVEP
jgi:hypothetical protein